MPDTPALRRHAHELLEAGRIDAAIAAQLALINASVHAGQPPPAQDLHQFGVILFARRDFGGAAQAFAQAARSPGAQDLPALTGNLGMSLVLAGRPTEALPLLQQAAAAHPDQATLDDALAHALGLLGRIDEARRHGERALARKDAAAGPAPEPVSRWPAGRPLPAVAPGGPPAVIAFSLFGQQPRYLRGALANVEQAARLYPHWRCRFYLDDSVPAPTRQALQQAGAELRRMPAPARPADALFWRFLVAEDPQVGRFLVRDADSVLNPREAAAVAEWLASGQPFHLMRDHAAHTDLVLAGLWGGVAGWLPPLQQMLQGFSYRPGSESRSADQLFLGQRVWPRIRAHCRIHDSLYRGFGATGFPPGSALPPGRHVGDNDHAFG